MKRILLALLILSGVGLYAQSAGINNTFIVLNVSGNGDLYYDLNANTPNYDFNGNSIGTFCQGATNGIIFKGGENNIYKCGGCDVTSTRLYYRVYLTGTTPGSFVSNNIGYSSGFNNGCGGQDQKWANTGYNVNILSGLGAGDYTFEVYSDATSTCFGTVYAGNGGANYKAYFTISATSVGGTVAGTQSICSGSTPSALTLSGHTGSVTKWQRSTSSDFTSGVTDIANTSTTLSGATIGTLTATTYFRAVVTSGACSSANSSAATVTVNTPSVGGTASGSQTICSGSTPTDITLSGYTGSINKWQRSTSSDFTSGVTDIANTTTTLSGASIGSLTTTTYFRAVITNGSCPSANSSVATVTVSAASVGGTASGSQTICSGSTPADIILSGQTGNVTKWQRSTLSDFTSGVTDIANTTTTLSGVSIGSLTATTYFRAVVTNGVCSSSNSSVATVTVSAASVGGTASGNQAICSGSTPADITLSGQTGNVTKWQRSTSSDFTSGVTDIANTTTTLSGASIGSLTTTTYFTAVITNGSCPSANSSVATVTVSAASVGGTASGSQAICSGSTPADITLSGQTGNVTKWQRSTSSDFTSGVTDIANTTTTLSGISIGSLTTTTYFRAVVANGACSSANSLVATVTVHPPSVGGTVSGSNSFCSGANSGTLTLSGHTGSVVKWQSSTTPDFSASVSDITNTTPTLNFTNVSQTTYYRAEVKSGACTSAYSSVASVTINHNTWTGAVSNEWTLGANWSCGIVPDANTDIVIGISPNEPFIGYGDTIYGNSLTVEEDAHITIQSGANLIITNAVTIDNNLDSEGAITGGGLIIQNNANLIQVNDTANSGYVQVEKESAPIFRLDYALWSSPVSGETLKGFSPNTLDNRFYHYNPATDAYTPVAGTTEFAEGSSYLIRVDNTHPAYDAATNYTGTPWAGTYIGTPNNGNVTVDASTGYNAVGNPYPSPINIAAFYSANSANLGSDAALYFWRKKNGSEYSSYASLTLAGYTANGQVISTPSGNVNYGDASNGQFSNASQSNTWVLNPGQGFIVQSNGNDIVFNNAMRRPVNNGQLFDIPEVAPSRLWIDMSDATGSFHQAMIAYTENGTLGIDYAMDGRALTDGAIAIYSLLDDIRLGIQARPSFSDTDVVPMGYKAANAGTYTISLHNVEGVFAQDQDIFLRDNLLGTTHDLKAGSYQFTTEAGTFAGRFDVIYAQPLGTAQPVADANSVIAYKNGNAISISSGAANMTGVTVYDTRGRMLYNATGINATETTVSGLQAQQQVLIVKVTTDRGTVTKKIIF